MPAGNFSEYRWYSDYPVALLAARLSCFELHDAAVLASACRGEWNSRGQAKARAKANAFRERNCCASKWKVSLLARRDSSSLVPEGHSENSPAFQRRVVRFKNHPVPEGRKKIRLESWIFRRPSGTCLYSRLNPALKRGLLLAVPPGQTPCLNPQKVLG